jgi:hypothetical protein|mmetsp:Transcript_6135/g.18060  ORF Transcript_6135/g.18060 Transcript_6135/m.18060 type:complete len:242 (-) Transcript_6135:7159-7884(-)
MASMLKTQFGTQRISVHISATKRSIRSSVIVSAESRPLWMPGTSAPSHLKGTLPGDYGFDPLNLGEDSKDLDWYVQAELQHARWAMLGVAGMAAPELLTKLGVSDLPNWHDAPFYNGYFASATTIFTVQMFMMNWAEIRRWQDIKNPGSVSEDPAFSGNKLPVGDVGYPGGIFNPMNYGKKNEELKALKAKEIANGRLAMVAALGCFIQYDHTGVGPVENLTSHLSNPSVNNVFKAAFIGF